MSNHPDKSKLDHEEFLSTSFSDIKVGQFLRPQDTAKLLKELVWNCFELSRLAFGWMPALEDYELKIQLGRFGYLHAMHVKQLSERIAELPDKLGFKERSPQALRELYERGSLAPNSETFFYSYFVFVRNLYDRIEELSLRLDTILDAPTMDVLDLLLMKKQELLTTLRKQFQFVPSESDQRRQIFQDWKLYVSNLWHAYSSRQVWPPAPGVPPAGPVPAEGKLDPRFPHYSHKPDQYKKAYSDPGMSPLQDSIQQMHYINATEMSAAESLSYLYYAVQNMPLAFYFDLARHLWDETRHFAMGVRRLLQLGYSLDQFQFFKSGPGKQVEDSWYADMYASLTMVAEPCSFIKKRKAAEAFWEFGDALSAIHCEFDMVDERMHVDFGKRWGHELFKTLKNDLITAQKLSERARLIRLEYLDVPLEERQQIAKNFPAFCGFSTVELSYSKY
ncbi:DUF455 family protein [Paenibacillus sp. LMG 31461]|uniref:DUF455 family protein n=1 Tax=Paenibacillus plantarum TaxID=2654975 RepID=A0ABX1XN24_9BACL|nr:DUF455 family protein [Paenibacillus plantarum]NOU69441.1 DUF455 family protein [Paenibacillus plantarum]